MKRADVVAPYANSDALVVPEGPSRIGENSASSAAHPAHEEIYSRPKKHRPDTS
jgi:hypothetical protein